MIAVMKNGSTKTPLVLEIKGNSLDDGPGIRTVVFFKGCPLSCVWCHNPESKKSMPEISFDANACVNCGTCRELCPEHALSPENRYYIDRNKCTMCLLCAKDCPSGALAAVGRKMPVETILEKILPDRPFFETSGGGATLSGGEPALHMDFVSLLLGELKQHGIHTLIETSGYFSLDEFMEKLYPFLDTIYFDIKIMDSGAHIKYCGVPNEKILGNFRHIFAAASRDGKRVIPRTPLVPGITDTRENIRRIADFLKCLGVSEAALLAYNPLWHDKCRKVGAMDPYSESREMSSFPEREILERCRAVFAENGIRA
jgi:pyruvate formate lyase activating enzyme